MDVLHAFMYIICKEHQKLDDVTIKQRTGIDCSTLGDIETMSFKSMTFNMNQEQITTIVLSMPSVRALVQKYADLKTEKFNLMNTNNSVRSMAKAIYFTVVHKKFPKAKPNPLAIPKPAVARKTMALDNTALMQNRLIIHKSAPVTAEPISQSTVTKSNGVHLRPPPLVKGPAVIDLTDKERLDNEITERSLTEPEPLKRTTLEDSSDEDIPLKLIRQRVPAGSAPLPVKRPCSASDATTSAKKVCTLQRSSSLQCDAIMTVRATDDSAVTSALSVGSGTADGRKRTSTIDQAAEKPDMILPNVPLQDKHDTPCTRPSTNGFSRPLMHSTPATRRNSPTQSERPSTAHSACVAPTTQSLVPDYDPITFDPAIVTEADLVSLTAVANRGIHLSEMPAPGRCRFCSRVLRSHTLDNHEKFVCHLNVFLSSNIEVDRANKILARVRTYREEEGVDEQVPFSRTSPEATDHTRAETVVRRSPEAFDNPIVLSQDARRLASGNWTCCEICGKLFDVGPEMAVHMLQCSKRLGTSSEREVSPQVDDILPAIPSPERAQPQAIESKFKPWTPAMIPNEREETAPPSIPPCTSEIDTHWANLLSFPPSPDRLTFIEKYSTRYLTPSFLDTLVRTMTTDERRDLAQFYIDSKRGTMTEFNYLKQTSLTCAQQWILML